MTFTSSLPDCRCHKASLQRRLYAAIQLLASCRYCFTGVGKSVLRCLCGRHSECYRILIIAVRRRDPQSVATQTIILLDLKSSPNLTGGVSGLPALSGYGRYREPNFIIGHQSKFPTIKFIRRGIRLRKDVLAVSVFWFLLGSDVSALVLSSLPIFINLECQLVGFVLRNRNTQNCMYLNSSVSNK